MLVYGHSGHDLFSRQRPIHYDDVGLVDWTYIIYVGFWLVSWISGRRQIVYYLCRRDIRTKPTSEHPLKVL